MSHLTLGAGACRAGLAVAGFGDPYAGEEPQGTALQNHVNGSLQDARYIDPYTKDYIIDEQGRTQGQTSVSQQVYLALLTTFGSSVNANLGSQFSNIKTFSRKTIAAQIDSVVRKSLSNLISNNSIQLIRTEVSLNTNNIATNITVYWRDNFTNQNQQTSL